MIEQVLNRERSRLEMSGNNEQKVSPDLSHHRLQTQPFSKTFNKINWPCSKDEIPGWLYQEDT